MKKIAPPGRRGSAQSVKRFEGDELVDGIEGGLRRRGGADGGDADGAVEEEAERMREVERQETQAARENEERLRLQQEQIEAEQQRKKQEQEQQQQQQQHQEEERARQERARQAKAAEEEEQRKEQEREQEQQKERARKQLQQQQEQQQRQQQEEQQQKAREAEAAADAERKRLAEQARLEQQQQQQQQQERMRVEQQQRDMEEQAISAARAEREAQRQRELEEEARVQAHEKEQERLASQQRANEAALSAAAITAKESAVLDEARRKAEETARKRAMFLSDMDDFSTTFEDKTREADEQRRLLGEREGQVLTQGMSEISGAFVPPAAAVKAAAEKPAQASTPAPPPAPVAPVVQQQQPQTAQMPQHDGSSRAAFNELSSSLFATRGKGIDAIDESKDAGASAGPDTEVLRMPTRIGQSGKPIATPQLSSAAAYPEEEEEEEEEGMGAEESISNVLTLEERKALSPQERVAWRALQQDLTTRRREFHGAVTYAFDGIFSWQMYGSAEAVDETGAAYTEYLMRCQWGTSWENMQPWISARRYREFDALDADLKRAFPSMEHSMPRLPAKDFFRFLEQDVIEKRRGTLENYMTRIVAHLPTVLRSGLFSEFLGIGERIATIKPMLGLGAPSAGPTRGAALGGEQLRSRGGSSSSSSSSGSSSSGSGSSSSSSPASGNPSDGLMGEGKVDFESCGLILTVDQAEADKAAKSSPFFIDSELSLLEEQIRDLTLLLRSARPQELLFKNQRAYYLLVAITTEWPRLRATADMGAQHMDMDFTLIPRAMQIEEDLVRCIGDFKSLLAAHGLVA